MTKKLFALASASALVVVAGSAQAAPPGEGHFANKGELVVSGDRMFGVSISSTKAERSQGNATVTSTESSTGVNFLWGGNLSGTPNPYAIPRIAVDFAVIDGLMVGGSIGVMTASGKTETSNGGQTQSQNGPSVTAIAFAPRAGYVIAFGKHGLWLRGGITYFNVSSEQTQGNTTTKTTFNGLSFNVEPTFVFGVGQNVGFTGGLVIDIPLSGESEIPQGGQTLKIPTKITNFGAAFGMLVHF